MDKYNHDDNMDDNMEQLLRRMVYRHFNLSNAISCGDRQFDVSTVIEICILF
jgi:hypothetical protein